MCIRQWTIKRKEQQNEKRLRTSDERPHTALDVRQVLHELLRLRHGLFLTCPTKQIGQE